MVCFLFCSNQLADENELISQFRYLWNHFFKCFWRRTAMADIIMHKNDTARGNIIDDHFANLLRRCMCPVAGVNIPKNNIISKIARCVLD